MCFIRKWIRKWWTIGRWAKTGKRCNSWRDRAFMQFLAPQSLDSLGMRNTKVNSYCSCASSYIDLAILPSTESFIQPTDGILFPSRICIWRKEMVKKEHLGVLWFREGSKSVKEKRKKGVRKEKPNWRGGRMDDEEANHYCSQLAKYREREKKTLMHLCRALQQVSTRGKHQEEEDWKSKYDKKRKKTRVLTWLWFPLFPILQKPVERSLNNRCQG